MDNKFEKEQKVLNSPFDLETHKKTFVNYFEAAILPNGTIEYCIPSHEQYIWKYLMKILGFTRDDIMKMTQNMYDAYVNHCGLILCWSCRYEIKTSYPTDEQIKTLAMLIKEGLTTNKRN